MTDYGLVSTAPAIIRDYPQDIIQTDGNDVFFNQKKLSATDAGFVIQNNFRTALDDLPFTASGCTWSAIQIAEGDYLVVLMDAEERFSCGSKDFT